MNLVIHCTGSGMCREIPLKISDVGLAPLIHTSPTLSPPTSFNMHIQDPPNVCQSFKTTPTFISKLIKMCQQRFHRHICSHAGCGPLIPCSNSSQVLHAPTHSISRSIQLHSTHCPFCSNPALSRLLPVILIDPLATYPYNSIVYSVSPTTPITVASPQSSLSAPDSTYRDIRYETIRGSLVPIEHFHFNGLPPSLTGRAGYNPLHGFDSGPLPPGWGLNPSSFDPGVDFSKLGLSYDLAFSSTEDSEGNGEATGPTQPRNASSATSSPPSRSNASSAASRPSPAGSREPTVSNGSSPPPPRAPTLQPPISSRSSAESQPPGAGSESTSSEGDSGEAANGTEARGAST